MSELEKKETQLKTLLKTYGSLSVAYSGGVDSTYLAAVAHEVLLEDCELVLADSASIPRSEVDAATDLAKTRGWNLHVIKTQEFENPEYLKNDKQRCYFCKTELFDKMTNYVQVTGRIPLAYGAIEDDRGDIRPGEKAAVEHEVVSPLQTVNLYKDEIRVLSRQRNLPTWNKASFACLASRFPMGTEITIKNVGQVEQAEEVLKSRKFYQYRVRHHGDLCRIEIDFKDLARFIDMRESIVTAIKAVGYRHVTLDLSGYRIGSTAF